MSRFMLYQPGRKTIENIHNIRYSIFKSNTIFIKEFVSISVEIGDFRWAVSAIWI